MLLSSVYLGLPPQLPVTPSVPKKQMERTWAPKLPEPSCWPVGTGKPHPARDRNDLQVEVEETALGEGNSSSLLKRQRTQNSKGPLESAVVCLALG